MMNLNIATKVQLMQAVQIGPAFANDLIKARPFGSWDEVAKLSGIGKVRLSNLQSLFFLSGAHKPFVSDLESCISGSEDELEFEVIDDDDEEFETIDDDDEKFELTVPAPLRRDYQEHQAYLPESQDRHHDRSLRFGAGRAESQAWCCC